MLYNNNFDMNQEIMDENDMNADEMNQSDLMLPKVIVIDQPYIDKFPLSEALQRGTIFPNLYLPYLIRKA